MWTNLIKHRPAAKRTIDLKFLAVFSHRRGMRLKRLMGPMPYSTRDVGPREEGWFIAFVRLCGMTGVTPHALAAPRLASLA